MPVGRKSLFNQETQTRVEEIRTYHLTENSENNTWGRENNNNTRS